MTATPSSRPVSACLPSLQESNKGKEVWLHIYDLGPVTKWAVNSWAKPFYSSGMFHAGLEVLGMEFAFRGIRGASCVSMSGICCHAPKQNHQHVYRESISLGTSPLSKAEIIEILEALELEWKASSYNAVFRNCVNFAECFARELQTPLPVPQWVNSCARQCSSDATMKWLNGCEANVFGSVASSGSCDSCQSCSHSSASSATTAVSTPSSGSSTPTSTKSSDSEGVQKTMGRSRSISSVSTQTSDRRISTGSTCSTTSSGMSGRTGLRQSSSRTGL